MQSLRFVTLCFFVVGSLVLVANCGREIGPQLSIRIVQPNRPVPEYECYAVNVVGPGIKAPDGALAPNLAGIQAGDHCAYPGATSTAETIANVTADGLSVRVPAGKDRMIQLLGIDLITGGSCPSSTSMAQILTAARTPGMATPDIGAIYEVGRVQVDLVGNTTATITVTHNASTPKNARFCKNNAAIISKSPDLWFTAEHYLNQSDGASLTGDWLNFGRVALTDHLAQTATPPVLTRTASHGLPSVDFASTTNAHRSGFNAGVVTDVTIFAVAKRVLPIVGDIICISEGSDCGGTNSHLKIAGGSPSKHSFYVYRTVPETYAGIVIDDSNFNLHEAHWDNTGSPNWDYSVDRGGTTLTSTAFSTDNTGGFNFSAAGYVLLSGTSTFTGSYSEVIVFLSALTTTERTAVRNYLEAKYGF